VTDKKRKLLPNTPLTGIQVLGIRFRGSQPSVRDERCLDAYRSSGVYQASQVPFWILEPVFPEQKRETQEIVNLGILGGEIAVATADARNAKRAIMLTGGDCTHITGIIGGLQKAHGADIRIGLVWFDAHGDFNTPGTTLSGMLGGMPVAVCAGLAFPEWRERSQIKAPLPTDRILMVGLRNLDPPEARLIQETDIMTASLAPGFEGEEISKSVDELANRCDLLYLHVDSDILDERFVPNHRTREPNGPDLEQVGQAIETVMATGKVAVFAVVSVYGEGTGGDISKESGIRLICIGLQAWRKHGFPQEYS